MFYSVIIYLITILPFSIKNYLIDGNKWIFQKILNSIITLYYFVLFSGTLKWGYSVISSSYYPLKNSSKLLNYLFIVCYSIIIFVFTVQVIRLAIRKEKGRNLFLKLLPIVWILLGIYKYQAYIHLNNIEPSILHIILSNSLTALILGSTFLIYMSKRMKDFLSQQDKL